MDIKTWVYYNHAIIPATSPHINPDIKIIEDGSVWKHSWGGGTLISKMDN